MTPFFTVHQNRQRDRPPAATSMTALPGTVREPAKLNYAVSPGTWPCGGVVHRGDEQRRHLIRRKGSKVKSIITLRGELGRWSR